MNRRTITLAEARKLYDGPPCHNRLTLAIWRALYGGGL